MVSAGLLGPAKPIHGKGQNGTSRGSGKGERMSRKTRYDFAKWVYPDYVVLIKHKDKYITYENDRFICDYIGFYTYDSKRKYRFKTFLRYQINYLILDELEITELKKFVSNNYNRYVYLINIRRIVKKIGNKLIKS